MTTTETTTLGERAAGEPVDANGLTMTRVLPASTDRVFEAFIRPELARQWMAPGELSVAEVEIDARVGGSYRIVMRAPDGETHSPSGVYEEIIPNQKLVYTWKWAHDELVTRVTIELRPVGENQTELTLIHTGFTDAEMKKAHNEGWMGCFAKLGSLLA